ncbi:hypothetical protein [Thioclava sp. SK-1]|uniref:hypothetical protein n=1 Tax=Thioclava sp. SK-1 TaxID=1889770 RepID=UPI00159F2355|nr:hypothetical protein [Thioclava sp. SK-1]
MIVVAALIIGAIIGNRRARSRGGNTMDRVQFASVYAICFALVALFVTIVVGRSF